MRKQLFILNFRSLLLNSTACKNFMGVTMKTKSISKNAVFMEQSFQRDILKLADYEYDKVFDVSLASVYGEYDLGLEKLEKENVELRKAFMESADFIQKFGLRGFVMKLSAAFLVVMLAAEIKICFLEGSR